MPKNVVITPLSGLVDFYDLNSNLDAKIQIDDAGSLSITNTGGTLTLGNAAANVYIGDGTNSVDVIFEQNGAIRALTGKTLTLGNSASNITVQSPLTINSAILNTTTTGYFEVRQTVSTWTNSTSHPIIKWDYNATYDDHLYLASGGNAAGTTQTGLVITENAGVVIGIPNANPNSTSVLSTEWFRFDTSKFTITRNATQYITFENSDTTTNPIITSYTGTNNAKPIIFDSKTDAANTAPTAGALGYEFRVNGTSALTINTDRTISTNTGLTVGGTLSVTGNLTVNGTTTTVNSTTVTIDDPIFTLGGDTAPTVDDNKDRGIEFRWHNGTTSKVGFFGYDDSTGYLTFIPDATNTSEVFSGTLGDIQATNFRGNLIGSAANITGGTNGAIPYKQVGGVAAYSINTSSIAGTNYLTIPSNSSLKLGSSGAITIEFWFKIDSLPVGTDVFIIADYDAFFNTGYGIAVTPTGAIWFIAASSPGIYVTTNTTSTAGTWNHVAVVRQAASTFFTVYLNGIASGTHTGANTAIDSNLALTIGTTVTNAAQANFKGKISNLRIVKGTALYTANFTPTGPLTAISNTSLLTARYTTITDGSTNNFTITTTGTVVVSSDFPPAVGDINAIEYLPIGTSGKYLSSNGTAPVWADISGGITYTRVTTNTTLTDKQGVIADTSGGTFTVTLPATPATGAQVAIADGAAWGTTNLTVARNGSTIEGLAENLTLDITGALVNLIYDGTTWEVYSQVGGGGGSLVTLTGTETLTNKTINGTNNTITNVSLTTGVTGVLPVANGGTGGTLPVTNGGTGAATLALNNVLLGNGTSALQAVAPGTTGNVLTSNGTTWQSTAPAITLAGDSTWTGTQTFSGTTSKLAMILSDAGEVCTVSATAATGTINYDITTQSVLYYTTNASGNWTVNFRASSGTTLNTIMAVGQTVTAAFLVTQGSTAYYNSAVQVDGVSVTPKWQGGTAPSAGNASSIDVYTYTIIKTAAATFTVLAAQTRFA